MIEERKMMVFPPQAEPVTGRFVLSSGAESIRQSVSLILQTRKGERPARPDYGVPAYSRLERENCGALAAAVEAQEPRVSRVSVSLGEQAGVSVLEITYIITESGKADSLTLPVYPKAGAGEEAGGDD